MGDDLNNSQFDYDEDAFVASATAAESEGESEDGGELVDETQAKSLKKEKKKRKFQELKEKKKRVKLSTDFVEEDALGEGVPPVSLAATSPIDPYTTVRMALRDSPLNAAAISSDMFYLPKTSKANALLKKKCPFFLAIQNKLPNFQNMKKTPGSEVGSPLVIIVSVDATRCVDIIKTLSRFAQCKIAKLFAKHFKVEQQVEMLQESYHPIAVGTPNRLNKLVDIGALSLVNTKVVIVDMEPDAKSFTVLNSPNVKDDALKFLVELVAPHSPNVNVALI